ncbi:MAG: hypothetical protein R2695_02985 [Acidimicrobiales bacterium]
MTPEEARLQFRQWLIDHDLEADVAHAILESMPPFDWSEIARQRDVEAINARFDAIDTQFEGMRSLFDATRLSIEAQMVAMEGRLSMRWMETTRIIVFAVIAMFLAISGVIIGVAG